MTALPGTICVVRLNRSCIRIYKGPGSAVRAIRPGAIGNAVILAIGVCQFHLRQRITFVRLCEEGMRLAKKYRREDILQEVKPKQMLELYFEHTQEERDLNAHLKEVEAWK